MPAIQKSLRRPYTQEVLEEAISAVQDGRMTVTASSKHFGIPRQTLKDKISGKYATTCKMGRPSILSSEEEEIIADWVISVGVAGFPVSKDQLLSSVSKLMISLKRTNPFSNTAAIGEKWLSLFLHRRPEISARVTQALTTARANVTEDHIRGWFNDVTVYIKNKDLLAVFEDPSRIFNCDETAFFLCPKGKKVFVKKGQKAVYTITGNNEKECLTALITANAAGDLAPPMVVYSYERVPEKVAKEVPGTWGIGKSENGWMTGETFYEFMTNIFHPWLLMKGIKKPVIMFLDGHTSHLTYHLSQFCTLNKIELISLYPNSTHVLQPMDVAVFHPLKAAWRQTVETWRNENGAAKIKKEDFAPLLKTCLEKGVSKEAIKGGFATTGLADLSADKVDFKKIIKHNKSTTNMKEPYSHSQWLVLRGHLSFLETKIGTEKLTSFRSDSVAVEDTSLFNVWKGTKEEVALYRQRLEDRGKKTAEVGTESTPATEVSVESMSPVKLPTEEPVNLENATVDLFEDLPDFPIELNLPVISVPGPSDSIYNTFTDTDIITVSALEASPSLSDLFKSPSSEVVQMSTQASHDLDSPRPTTSFMNTEPTLKTPNKMPLTPEELRANVPSPFKKALFWPGPSPSTKKRAPKVKLPSAITSEEWKHYYLKKEEEKKKNELEKEKRKEMREVLKKMKKEKEDQKKPAKRRKVVQYSDNEDDTEDLGVQLLEEESRTDEPNLDIENIQPSQWVVVPYTVNDEEKEYVGQVMKKSDGMGKEGILTIKFVEKKLLSNKFVWPTKDDIDEVQAVVVKRVLKEPTFDRWGYLTFEDF